MWAYIFVTPFDPATAGSFDSDETFFMWHIVSNAYVMKIAKRVYKRMSAPANALSTSFKTHVTYDVFSTYAYDLYSDCPYDSNGWISNCTAWNFLYADANGVSYYTDVDPVNVGNIIGSMGGAFNYVILAFSTVFGFAIRRKWRALEEIRVEKIAAERSTRKIHRKWHLLGGSRVSIRGEVLAHDNDEQALVSSQTSMLSVSCGST
jgi:hypothetical protein